MCDANLSIMDVVARWPGSTHDSFIWRNSFLRHRLSSSHQRGDAYLLGDSGYPLEPWLLTPYAVPCSSPQEEIFNIFHTKTRSAIERCFGMLKSRFRILDNSGGILLYNPEKCCKIIIAAAILHNICIKYNVPDTDIEITGDETGDETEDETEDEEAPDTSPMDTRGSSTRDYLALSFQRLR